MAAKKRSKVQIEADRKETAALYLKGETQAAIGVRLGLSQGQIHYDLKRIRKAWLESALQDFDSKRGRELARLDHLESVAWTSFDKSSEDGPGDKRFLDVVAKCIERRCRLFGLDAPDKVKVSWQASLPEGYEADQVKAQFAAMLAVARRQAADD